MINGTISILIFLISRSLMAMSHGVPRMAISHGVTRMGCIYLNLFVR